MERRFEKIQKKRKPKGITIVGRARDYAEEYIPDYRNYSRIKGHKNQRQKRKVWRNAPHMRKKAA